MALLELKNIGKIYVSESNVSVGIRNVNLSFNQGEFVAITGKSGSGKSTLLNVLSGMDSYEEGELLIEGDTTSHYVQSDWEEYRKNYISFIFQDYNILESFTVLENVELALLHIQNKKERRSKAIELLKRVGLESHLKHKGSKLSGGQKQRTVIARALAKDSPIILADEPTGNLDSDTSKEILQLLKEVSKDKLVIVVTHNYDDVKEFATRHIRIFDGSIEEDHYLTHDLNVSATSSNTIPTYNNTVSSQVINGITLGFARYKSKPKLSIFLSFLLTLTLLSFLLITSLVSPNFEFFKKDTLFTEYKGRVVISKYDSTPISFSELDEVSKEVEAVSYKYNDFLLDSSINTSFDNYEYYEMNIVERSGKDKVDVGRLPDKDNEVLLRAPIEFKKYFTSNLSNKEVIILYNNLCLNIVGIDYYLDNTITPSYVLSSKAYNVASCLAYMNNTSIPFNPHVISKTNIDLGIYNYLLNFSLSGDEHYIYTNRAELLDSKARISIFSDYRLTSKENYSYGGFHYDVDSSSDKIYSYSYDVNTTQRLNTLQGDAKDVLDDYLSHKLDLSFEDDLNDIIVISPDIFLQIFENQILKDTYTQSSLFFKNDLIASKKLSKLNELGYLAIPSYSTKDDNIDTEIFDKIGQLFYLIIYVLFLVFIASFLNLCSHRILNASKNDLGIMRSMGISKKTIIISVYSQNFISFIPSLLISIIAMIIIYTNPTLSYSFNYLHLFDYCFILLSMIVVLILLGRNFTKYLFKSSVKKTIKGGSKS